MPVPNVATLYQKIRKGSEGGHEFSRLVSALLSAEYGSKGERLQLLSDASGDYNGLDAIIFGDEPFPEILTGFQYKFYPQNFSSVHKASIKSSLEAAMNLNQAMNKWILFTPEDLLKNDMEWFEKLKKKVKHSFSCRREGWGTVICTFEIGHWGHTRIIELCLKHEHIGRKYFPELFQFDEGKFRLLNATLDLNLASWNGKKNGKSFQQIMPNTKQTSDPVFDFHFSNDTKKTFLLYKIDVIIESIWSGGVHGIPTKHQLKSLGKIEFEVDFKEKENVYEFDEPIIFPPNKPMRFHFQLTQFTKKCPGYGAQLYFRFGFDSATLVTDLFTLTF